MGAHRKAFMALSAFQILSGMTESLAAGQPDGKYQFPAGEWSTVVSASP